MWCGTVLRVIWGYLSSYGAVWENLTGTHLKQSPDAQDLSTAH